MLDRRVDETEYEYGLRLIRLKVQGDLDLDWSELCDILDLDIHADSLRKAANVTPYSGVAVSNYYEEKIKQMLLDQSNNADILLKEIREEKDELYKERIKLQDERRHNRNHKRLEARSEMFVNEIAYAINELNKTKPLQFTGVPSYDGRNNIASLLISDTHFGMKNNTFANHYNLEVAKKRIVTLYEEVISKCLMHNVETLHVELLGDLVHGVIHTSARLLQETDVVKQIIFCEEVISEFLVAIAKEIPNVIVHMATGNHSRISKEYRDHLECENFETLILNMIKLRVNNISNISFDENTIDEELIVYSVFGNVIVGTHGHTKSKKFDSVIHLSNYLGLKVDQVHLGHYHQFAIQNNVIVNGSFCGADSYAQSLGFSTPPSQTLIIYDGTENRCLYEISLK